MGVIVTTILYTPVLLALAMILRTIQIAAIVGWVVMAIWRLLWRNLGF